MNTHAIWMFDHLRRIMTVGVAIALTILLWPALPNALGQDTKPAEPLEFFKVQLVHPAKVGDQIHMRREIEESSSELTEDNGKPQAGKSGSAALQINFYGTLEVLTANRQGHAEKWKVSAGVVSLRRPGGSGHEMLVKPGTEFTVSFAGGKATVADYEAKHPLSDDAKKFLPIVFEATGANGDASLGEILDNASVTKGMNWNVDSKAAAAELHNFDPKLKPADVTGSARLKSVVGDGDKKVLMVEYEFTAKSKKPANPPAGMTPVSAARSETGTVTVPANLSTGYFSAKSLIHTTSTYKKTATVKEKVKKTTKNVKVNEETVIEQFDKVNTLLTYESGGPAGKTESPSPSPAPSPSSASAATTQ